ncbi:CDP-alcohol phosphatidyltransferase [Cryomorpha ignava]|uniref:CDP-alcohol phosphatidyltransferase n=1 Tax=Cryomorpha ignava TaxID=101383 RepID=A0A7K3WLJ2_9FLAO|nr:CDP-alcohol phosphatidyltransferase family protein [Cryomorpha ignava]NEN22344.1 CDP-alcohol phosphatidyltransferase [Cryomorpha ignava]
MNRIPFLLVYSRILIAVIIAVLALTKVVNHTIWIVVLMSIGLITDVFDGIIARNLNVSTEKLRIWDSNVDQFFWIITIGSIFYLNSDFVKENIMWIGIIIILELLCYLISYLKFEKSIATHSLQAKLWTLILLVFLIDLALNATSQIPFFSCILIGATSRIEIILIIVKLKKWTTDVPSVFAVSKINAGIPIKKNKLFSS